MGSIPKSVGDWKPKVPTSSAKEKLLRPNAHDAKDTMTGTNKRERWVGGKGKPSEPLGQRGREF